MAYSATSQDDFNLSEIRSPQEERAASPAHSRNPFRRQPSWVNPSPRYSHLAPVEQNVAERDDLGYENERAEAHGLGLKNVLSSPGASVLKRKPVHPVPSPDPYTSYTPFSQATTISNSSTLGADVGAKAKWATPSAQSSRYSLQENPYKHTPDDAHLIAHGRGGSSNACPTQGDLLKPGWTWFTILVFSLGVFSWVC